MSGDYYRRHLPHWQPQRAVFFVTFRLKFSMPAGPVALPRANRNQEAANRTGGEVFVHWDKQLDSASAGPRWLIRPDVARLVRDELMARDGSQYELYAFSVMPNHVHALFEPHTGEAAANVPLVKIMQSLKGSTARKANAVLQREGAFWQDESFDRVVRNNRELSRVIAYIVNNPVRAGLVGHWSEWPWTYCRNDLAQVSECGSG